MRRRVVQGAMLLRIRLGNFLGHQESRGGNPRHPNSHSTPGLLPAGWTCGSLSGTRAGAPAAPPPEGTAGERAHPSVSVFFTAGLPLPLSLSDGHVFRGTVSISVGARVSAPHALSLRDRSIPSPSCTPSLCSSWAPSMLPDGQEADTSVACTSLLRTRHCVTLPSGLPASLSLCSRVGPHRASSVTPDSARCPGVPRTCLPACLLPPGPLSFRVPLTARPFRADRGRLLQEAFPDFPGEGGVHFFL